jgi:hypothetical protein
LNCDAGAALDVLLKIEAAIESPLVAGEITLGVLRVKRSTSVVPFDNPKVRQALFYAFQSGRLSEGCNRRSSGTPI